VSTGGIVPPHHVAQKIKEKI